MFSRRQKYYYVETLYQGQPYLLGPYNSHQEAQKKGFEKLAGELFEVKEYETSDLARATRMAKYGNDDEPPMLGVRVKHKL